MECELVSKVNVMTIRFKVIALAIVFGLLCAGAVSAAAFLPLEVLGGGAAFASASHVDFHTTHAVLNDAVL
jgi:hypothetical protein